MTPKLIVALHDVWPGSQAACKPLLQGLRERGIARLALMVVPNYAGQAPLRQYPDFVAWLKELHGEGCELFIHGLQHRADSHLPRSLAGKWINARLTDNESEMAGLAPELKARIAQFGCEACEAVGLPVVGFTPPTWFGSLPRRALGRFGLAYQDRRFTIECTLTRTRHFAPAIVWPSQPKATGMSGGKAYLHFALRFPLIRLALHPLDARHEDFWPTVEKLLGERSLQRYADLDARGASVPAGLVSPVQSPQEWPLYPL